MAGTAKDIVASEIHQGPGNLWKIATAPLDAAPRLVLASDGTPDATTHGACTHYGLINSAITASVKPKFSMLDLDQYEASFDAFVTDEEATIEAELAQTNPSLMASALGVGTYSSGSGYTQIVFGGNLVVPEVCVAAISPKRTSPLKHIVAVLYKAAATGGFQVVFGRSKMSTFKMKFIGLADFARTAGRQMGIVFETLADAAGGTVTAMAADVTQLYQGPGDLWLIDDPPTNTTKRVTIDPTTLTPDSTAHATSKHLGASAGEISLTVTPKLGYIRIDQVAGPVGVFIESLEAKIEAEMSQTEMTKLAACLGIGTYSGNATPPTTWKQVTFGGTDQPAPVCIAAIAKKRSAPTLAGCMCLYSVQPVGGIEITMSRKKQSTYKVSFTGLLDLTRAAGSQMGIFHEMVAV